MSQCLTGKTIGELSTLSGLSGNTLFIVEQDGITYHIPFSAFGINANSCITETLTYAQMTGKTSTNSLKPGCFYMITDADPTLYGGTNIIIQAFSTNELVLQAHGIFYTPPYDQSTLGFGIWTTGGTYSIGNVAYWGGYVWENLTGSVGTSTDIYNLDNTNWSAKTYNPIDYNVSVDIIHYDFSANTIIYRKDKFNNEVSVSKYIIDNFLNNPPNLHPIKSFQWGNGLSGLFNSGVGDNIVINSIFECINFRGYFVSRNYLNNLSLIYSNNCESFSTIDGNYLNSSCLVSGNTLTDGFISQNVLYNFCSIEQNDVSGLSSIQGMIMNNSSYVINCNVQNSSNIQENSLNDGSYFELLIMDQLSVVSYNKLSNQSYIKTNILNNGAEIINNQLNNSSNIYLNIMDLNSEINYNFLVTSSSIEDNQLTDGCSISENNLSSSTIKTNIVITIGGNIERNTLKGLSEIDTNFLTGSSIYNNNIYNEGKIKTNLLYFSNISANTIDNSVFDFSPSGTLSTKNISQINSKNCNVVSNISSATDIYLDCSKTIFKNSAQIPRLSYYNSSDVQIITNINN